MTGTQETSYQAPAKLKGKYASSDIFVFTSIIQSKGYAAAAAGTVSLSGYAL